MRKSLTKKFWNIEVWAVQKHVILVDLVKSFPTNIYLQNLASIQKRTSPAKFAHLAEKSANGSISNLSTKVRRGSEGPQGSGARAACSWRQQECCAEGRLLKNNERSADPHAAGWQMVAHFAKNFEMLHNVGRLVTACIETDFLICKQLFIKQDCASSKRFAHFCTAASSKF